MALNLPTFFKRLGSAIIFSIIMMVGLLWNHWAFIVLASLIQVLCLRDFIRVIKKIDAAAHWPSWLPVVLQVVALVWLWVSFVQYSFQTLWPALLCFPAVILLSTTLSKKTALQAGMYSLGGLLYIMLPMILFVQMRTISIVIPLALVLMIWMNDTMAYLVGSFIGKRSFSAVSPKKTWEGTIGGALLTIAGAAIWGHFSHYYNMIDWMVLALCAAVAGTAGDLLESKLKRLADVKDSGTLMPGHGGALDRFDSILIAIPFAFCYAYFSMPSIHLVIF